MANVSISTMAAAGSLDGTELMEVSKLSSTVHITATTLSAVASDNSYNDSALGFGAAGFLVGNRVKVTGFTVSAGVNNILSGTITALTNGKMTIGGTDGDVIVNESAGVSVTITKWDSKRTTVQAVANEAPSATTALASLTTDVDVVSTPPTNTQVLAYNSGTHKWEPAAAGGGGGGSASFDILSDQKSNGTINSAVTQYKTVAASGVVTLLDYTGGQAGYVDTVMWALDSVTAGNSDAFQLSTVNIYIDGSGTPDISIPAPMFFQGQYLYGNSGTYANQVYSNKFFGGNAGQISSGARYSMTAYSTLPIPFSTGVKITVSNGSASQTIRCFGDVKYNTGIANTWPYTRKLRMKYTNVSSPSVNSKTKYLDVAGKGRLVGLWFMSDSVPHTMTPAQADLEGDWVLYVDKATKVWSAALAITSGDKIIDSNGNLQTASSTGTTGGSAPTWSQVGGATTTDNTVTWVQTPGEPDQVWIASTAYALNMSFIDSNGWVQRVTTAGTSASSQPSFNVTPGGTTTDGSATWTNQGSTYMASALHTDGTESYFMLGYYFQNIPSWWTQNGYIGTSFINRGGTNQSLGWGTPSAGTPNTSSGFRYHLHDPIRFENHIALMKRHGDSSQVAWSSGTPETFCVVYYYTE